MSDNFIEASREKLKELMERPLGELRLCAVLVDGTPFKDRQMIVALGIGVDGRKTVLGLREGATENATVVSELLSDLAGRGLDFSVPRIYVLDGGKALAAAVRRHAGEAALIQRCQIHKRRNVLDHLPEEHWPAVQKALQNAYAMTEYADAKRALERLHRELMDLNPSAAPSLEEGLEETLTVHSLRVPLKLRRTLASTNVFTPCARATRATEAPGARVSSTILRFSSVLRCCLFAAGGALRDVTASITAGLEVPISGSKWTQLMCPLGRMPIYPKLVQTAKTVRLR